MISIVIPTLDEEKRIGPLLQALLALKGDKQIVVADGGSGDATVRIAASSGALVIAAPRGRGSQMRAGAEAASGGTLWFVHADCLPSPGSLAAIQAALDDPATVGGNFRLEFQGRGWTSRSMTWIYPKLRRIGLIYGDASIFVRRSEYQSVGGFRRIALFEDVDLIRRLRARGRFVHLNHSIATSSRRFEGWNYPRAWLVWMVLQSLYWMGVPPGLLAKLYHRAR